MIRLKSVLITSIGSKIGLQIAIKLSETGLYTVTGTYRSFTPSLETYSRTYGWFLYQYDFLNSDFPFLPGDGFDYVLHTTSISSPNTSLLIEVNTKACLSLIRFLQTSSCVPFRFINLSAFSIYEGLSNKHIDDSSPPFPSSIYSSSKFTCELMFNTFLNSIVPSIVHLRLPGVLLPDATSSLLPRTLELMLNNKQVSIYNPDTPLYALISIDSLFKLISSLLNSNNTSCSPVAIPVWSTPDITVRDAFLLLAAKCCYDKPFVESTSLQTSSIESALSQTLDFQPESASIAIKNWLSLI